MTAELRQALHGQFAILGGNEYEVLISKGAGGLFYWTIYEREQGGYQLSVASGDSFGCAATMEEAVSACAVAQTTWCAGVFRGT